MRTLITNADVDDTRHEQPDHPERPDRLTAARAGIADLRLGERLVVVPARAATHDELRRVHDPAYLEELGTFCYEGGGDIDQDTYATYDSWSIARHAAGAGLAVIDALSALGDGVGFVAARPPGHHATRDRAMGFCLINNIAVAAATLSARGERVLIVDWDVHHGNGTQSIFWNDPRVMYVSTHQWPLFPGSGGAREVGGPGALGRTLNVPLPPHAAGDALRRAFESLVEPEIEVFQPTWVLVSAGFDAHRDDPMADLDLSSGDFAWLASRVARYAKVPGRVALFLEGGYDLVALRRSVAATLAVLTDADVATEPPTHGSVGAEEVRRAHEERQIALRVAEDDHGIEDQ